MNEMQTTLPAMPSDEFIIASLEQPLQDGIRSENRQILVSKPISPSFLRHHIVLQISLRGGWPPGYAGPPMGFAPPPNGAWARTPVLNFAYDGKKLISLGGLPDYAGVAEVLRAEAESIDRLDPADLAGFFCFLTGALQNVAGCSADSPMQNAKPSLTGTEKDGWELHFYTMRHLGGCIPSSPLIFQYRITIAPDFQISGNQSEYGLYSRYNIRDIDSLNDALNDNFFYGVRQSAIVLCGQLQRAAAPFIPGLLRCLSDIDKHDIHGNSYGILEITLIHTLCQIIQAVEPDQVAKAAAPALVPYLCNERLNERPPGIRYVIIPALLRLRPDPSTTPGIIEAIKMIRSEGRDSQSPGVRMPNGYPLTEWQALIQLLGMMDPPSQSAIPFLEELAAADPNQQTRGVAALALQSIRTAMQGAKQGDAHPA